MGNYTDKSEPYYLSQEYADYYNSLVQDQRFLDELKSERECAYSVLFSTEEFKRVYYSSSILLYILSGIFICAGLWNLLTSDNNFLCAMCYLGTLLCWMIAHKLYEEHKKMIGRHAFDKYGYPQKIKTRVSRDQQHDLRAIQQMLADLERTIMYTASKIEEDKPDISQEKLFKRLNKLHSYIIKYKRLQANHKTIVLKYEQTQEHITDDFRVRTAIYSKIL